MRVGWSLSNGVETGRRARPQAELGRGLLVECAGGLLLYVIKAVLCKCATFFH